MTKTKKRNLILTLAVGAFAALAAFILWAFPSQTVKADTVDYSTYNEVTTGYVAANDFIVIFDDSNTIDMTSKNCQYTSEDEPYSVTCFFMATTIINFSDPYDNSYPGSLSALSAEDVALFYDNEVPANAAGSHFTAEHILFGTTVINAEDIKIPVEGYDSYGIRFFVPAVAEEPTEPENPSDPTEPTDPTEPENPGDPTESTNNEAEENKKPFDLGEWFYNAGEDVSTWISENVGIATTGSTVLIVAAVIVFVLIFKKRR